MTDTTQAAELNAAELGSRRRFLAQAGAASLGIAGLSLLAARPVAAQDADPDARSHQQLNALIISAAATAEALATTMYANIIDSSLFVDGLKGNANDKSYLAAGFLEEKAHYELLVSAGGSPLATTFYFPDGMFGDKSTYHKTVNTLITLEDAFIAAYLIGVRDFSTSNLRVLAGQIMGVEAEHRALGRVVAADLSLHYTTGLSGHHERVDGPEFAVNNLAYERKFEPPLQTINDIITALTPFVQSGAPGFSTTPYPYRDTVPGTVILPNLDKTTPTS